MNWRELWTGIKRGFAIASFWTLPISGLILTHCLMDLDLPFHLELLPATICAGLWAIGIAKIYARTEPEND